MAYGLRDTQEPLNSYKAFLRVLCVSAVNFFPIAIVCNLCFSQKKQANQ